MDGRTPQQIVQEFQTYRRSYRDTLGEFLAHYHKLYLDASDHGVMGVDGILHLIPLLPEEWRRWAASIIPEYIDYAIIGGNIYGDCPGFIAAISHQFLSYGEPPPGQHQVLPGYEALGILIDYEPPPLHPVPFEFEPVDPAPVVPEPEPEPVLEQSSETLSLPLSEQELDSDSYLAPFDTPVENSTPTYPQFETSMEVVPETPPQPPELKEEFIASGSRRRAGEDCDNNEDNTNDDEEEPYENGDDDEEEDPSEGDSE